MLGIKYISSYIPENHVLSSERTDGNETFLREKIGTNKLPKIQDISIADACYLAFEKLLKKTSLNVDEVECIVLCTQNPDYNGLPHNSSLIQSKIGAKTNTACFDIGLGCSGYVYSLSIIQSFMQCNSMKRGLLFTCDPYSKIIDVNDKNTAPLFGDAATVTLISDDPIYSTEKTLFHTDGANFDSIFNNNGVFFMNGRSVFNFVMKEVPTQINILLKDLELLDDDIDLYILHQGSKFMIEKVRNKITKNIDKLPFDISDTGNTVSSSIPIVLERYVNSGSKNIILCGFGVGLSCASSLLKLNIQENNNAG